MYVFPGGRRDRRQQDRGWPVRFMTRSRTSCCVRTQSQFRESAARGLAVAAAREMMEEAHLSLTPAEYAASLCPDVSHFRFLARAITPPGHAAAVRYPVLCLFHR
jgi:8-oxo-dGTP pyrophosphatase MutT (NUDIX family)